MILLLTLYTFVHPCIAYDFVVNFVYLCAPLLSCCEDSVSRKVMVLDLDETLIHSHHDGYVTVEIKS